VSVQALFVDMQGVYPRLLGPDACWGEERDARKFDGPGPVVAHPPCHLWINLCASNYGRALRDPSRKKILPAWYPDGTDGGLFAFAIACARVYGGVVEHPADSHAWAAHDIPKAPRRGGWARVDSGWVCVVWQSAYGARMGKPTQLFYAGDTPPADLIWEQPRGSHQVGWADKRGPARNLPTVSKREANATPEPFARALIALAEGARSPQPRPPVAGERT
jgi:hypothetical protein